jgi:hypothetical protein
MKHVIILLTACLLAAGSDPRGLRPRPNPSDYAAQETANGLTIAASVLTPSQVKSAFSTDLSQYTVVEVGIYPASGQTVDVTTLDFAMRVGAQGGLVRAANPDAIAAANQRKNSPPPSRRSDVTLYPSSTIGYESGTVYDPATGRQRRVGGVYTDESVGVGVGDPGPQPPRPGSTDRDRDVMGWELSDKTLPSGPTGNPVAGYLYFKLPSKARNSALELQYFVQNSGKIRVLLPPLRTK